MGQFVLLYLYFTEMPIFAKFTDNTDVNGIFFFIKNASGFTSKV